MHRCLSEMVEKEIAGFEWPKGYRCAATIAFDVDASSIDYRMWKNISGPLAQGDYGPRVGIPRIIDLLKKHDIKATFFIPGWVAERFPHRVKELYEHGHDVGGHMYLHEDSSELTHDQQLEIFRKTQKILGDITGAPSQGFRTVGPNWAPETIKEMCRAGWRYASSTAATCFPSRARAGEEEINLLQIHLSWILDDFRFFYCGPRGGAPGSGPPAFMPVSSFGDAFETWVAEFEDVYAIGGLYSLSCHPRAIGRPSRIRVLDKLIRYIKQYPDVWFVPVSKIADWVLSR